MKTAMPTDQEYRAEWRFASQIYIQVEASSEAEAISIARSVPKSTGPWLVDYTREWIRVVDPESPLPTPPSGFDSKARMSREEVPTRTWLVVEEEVEAQVRDICGPNRKETEICLQADRGGAELWRVVYKLCRTWAD